MPWAERVPVAATFLDDCKPDWVSLQFVPYGFHDKGWPWKLATYLQPLVSGRKVHVMFHELWLGGNRGAPFKERLIGILQRACIFRTLRSIKPRTISTSNTPYVSMLKKGGFDSQILPIFGSIPFSKRTDYEWVFTELSRAGVPFTCRDDLWLFCMFGSLHSIWPPEPLFSYLREAGKRSGRRIVLLSIGKLGAGETLWERLNFEYRDSIHFVRLGERSMQEVSAAMQVSDFGIATSPWELIGKSSSAASMIEHGLPVIVNRDEVHFEGVGGAAVPSDSLLLRMDGHLPQQLPTLTKRPPQAAGHDVAKRFVHMLWDEAG